MKKTTPKNLNKRLLKYSALSAALFGVSEMNGQIVHHILTPEHDGSTDYLINLNKPSIETPDALEDAINDFRVLNMGSVASNDGVAIEMLNGSALAVSGGFVYPFALDSGQVISSGNSNWNNTQFQTLNYQNYCAGTGGSLWCGVTDKYLGLRFDIGGNTHYGWAKLDVDASGLTWALKEYAFNATAGASIEAGQTTLSVETNALKKVKIIAINKTIALYNLPQSTTYEVFNLSGQKIMNGEIKDRIYTIEAKTVPTGIYIISIKDNQSNAVLSKKIVL